MTPAPQCSFDTKQRIFKSKSIVKIAPVCVGLFSIDLWMKYYNRHRCQRDLVKLSPDEYYRYITTGKYPHGMLPVWDK